MRINKDLNGAEYWRSLDQLAETPEFKEFLYNEFPETASDMTSAVSRRKFLTLMAASIAFAGFAGCRRPVEKIVPYVKAPENIVPGNPLFYATAMPRGISAQGIIVESHVGHPTKIEGNIKHRLTKGKSDVFVQASILNLYDPDRSKSLKNKKQEASWAEFVKFYQELHKKFLESQGKGLAILSTSFASPTLFRLYQEFKNNFPEAQWAVYEPVSDENILDGIKAVSAQEVYPVYDYAKAKVVLSFDADFLYAESENVSAVRGFSNARRIESENDTMNRLYVVENMYSITGAMADHRLRLPSSHIAPFALAIARELQSQGLEINIPDLGVNGYDNSRYQKWIKAVAKDLLQNKGNSLIVAGRRQPPFVHALIALMNNALKNTNNTVQYVTLKDTLLPSQNSLAQLMKSIDNNEINTLIILNGNPVYNAPADFDFAAKLAEVENTIHFSSHVDETSKRTTWHIPAAHYLESWGDVRSIDGTRSIIQPLIEPLFNGIMSVQFLNLIATGKDEKAYDIVRTTWQSIFPELEFEKRWRRTLNTGVNEDDLYENEKLDFTPESLPELSRNIDVKKLSKDKLEITFTADASVYDGSFANNGWLQEMPDPVSKLAWDNPALISPNTAKELGLRNEDMILLSHEKQSLKLPVWIMPGQADYTIVVALGYGRTNAGRIGNKVGFNAYVLRQSDAKDFTIGVNVKKLGERYKLANTQDHGSMEGRPLVRKATLAEYKSNPGFAAEMVELPPLKSLWEEPPYDKGYQWGMTIDLNACIGCNACMIACQSENNVPIVGKEQVINGREMSWIRLDRYFSGNLEDPEMVFQPVTCAHCELAPCEQVCPVAATVHDEEGLNVMVYNRCIGTRYCSNNCPYKVRRFNFFNYTKDYPEVIQMAQNPDVTVRSRGVMEKCTFCTQRINQAKNKAKQEGREITDGEVITACQQSCPANAITFGNILDQNSEVSKAKMNNRNYAMLGELNLKPRVTYLAKIRNPNPELVDFKQEV